MDIRKMSLKDILKEVVRYKFMDSRVYKNGTILTDEEYISLVMKNMMNDLENEIQQLEIVINKYQKLLEEM